MGLGFVPTLVEALVDGGHIDLVEIFRWLPCLWTVLSKGRFGDFRSITRCGTSRRSVGNRYQFTIVRKKESSRSCRMACECSRNKRKSRASSQISSVLPCFGLFSSFPMTGFNIPPKIMYPKEADRGLWGGEGIVVGFLQRKKLRQKWVTPWCVLLGIFSSLSLTFSFRVPRLWSPHLSRELFFSEILDRWMSIIVTQRMQTLVEEAGGFDYYILQVRWRLHLFKTITTLPQYFYYFFIRYHLGRFVLWKRWMLSFILFSRVLIEAV